jgi:hypothetical protein
VAAIDKMNALYNLSKDVGKTKQLLNSQVTKGIYTEEQVKRILSDIDIYVNTINSIPTNLTPETSLVVMQSINEIQKLEQLKKDRDKSFHPDIDEKIQELRNEITARTQFDYVNAKGKLRLKDEAARELVKEAEDRGEKNFTVDDGAITQRAIDNFNLMDVDEKLEYTDLTKQDLKTDKKQDDAIQEQEKREIPDEILNLKDDEVKVFTVENIEDVPEQFRDRAEKKEGTTVKVRRKILGLPIGKETERTIGEGYSYKLTGKEIKDYAIQKPSTEEQVLPDDAGSKKEGGDSEVGLQQVREGDTQQVTTDTQVEEGKTETDTTSDKTAQTDTEKVNLLSAIKEGQKLPTKPKQTKNENGVITSGKVHLYHSTNGIENLNNILENGIDFEKQKAVGGLFFSKLGSPYRRDDSFVVIETDIENIPFNQRTEGQEVALGQLSDYKIVHSSKMSPRELETLSSLEMILNRETNGGVEGYKKSLQNYKKKNKNSGA